MEKEFEKWWKDYRMEGLWDYKEYYHGGWEAALGWIFLQMVEFTDPRDIYEAIEKELRNEEF